MAKYKVKPLKEDDYEEWNKFVDESPHGTLFHTADWLRASGKNFEIYQCFKGQERVGGTPVVYSQVAGIRVIYNPPLTPYGGPIFGVDKGKYVSKVSTRKKVSQALIDKLEEDFGCVIDWRLSPSIVDLQPFIWSGFSSDVKYTYILTIEDLDEVWQNMDRGRRKDIRQAEEDNIQIEVSDEFEEIFSLVEKTLTRQEESIEFREFAFGFNKLLESQGQCKTFLARNDAGDPIAGVYIVWDDNRAYQLLSGFDPEKSHRGANPLAIWEAIKFTREELGLSGYDFEGSMIPGVEQYFRTFGGRLTPYYSVSWAKTPILLWLSRREWIKKFLGTLVYYR